MKSITQLEGIQSRQLLLVILLILCKVGETQDDSWGMDIAYIALTQSPQTERQDNGGSSRSSAADVHGNVVRMATPSTSNNFAPEILEFEAVFKGEDIGCENTYAKIEVNNDKVVTYKEEEVRTIGEAIADGTEITTQEILQNPSEDNIIASTNKFGMAVVDVMSTAVAEVKADVNSPQAGCWAIAYGVGKAVAIANATVTAIAQGFAAVLIGEKQKLVQDALSNIEQDIQEVVEQVVVLLADGSGSGEQSLTKTAVATAKAMAINCAMVQVFAAIADGLPKLETLLKVNYCPPQAYLARVIQKGDECRCLQSMQSDAPALCGQWGDKQNGDYICYVSKNCQCGQTSSKYPALKWRYCGPTLTTMNQWLQLEDEKNGIQKVEPRYGYCSQDPLFDSIASEAAPSPPPINCPIFHCIGDTRECCQLDEGPCSTSFGTTYQFVGVCSTGKSVWDNGSFQCVCQ